MDNVKFVVVGDVGYGKSTLIGRLLYDTKSMLKDKVEKISQVSGDAGQKMDFTCFLDLFKLEREQNIAIETTQIGFQTEKRSYSIIDFLGYAELIRDIMKGASRAEFAVLMADATDKSPEQSKLHAFILSMLGIKKIILAVNKMDHVNYEEEAFQQIVQNTTLMLNGFGLEILSAVPLSALQGENVTANTVKMDWYQGISLLAFFDQVSLAKQRDQELVYPIQDVYGNNENRLAVGMVESGELKRGSAVLILPSLEESEINTIEEWGESLDWASKGHSVGVTLKTPAYLEAGQIVTEIDSSLTQAKYFIINVFWISKKPLTQLTDLKIQCLTQESSCKINSIDKKINISTLKVPEENAEEISYLDMCQVSVKTPKFMVLDPSEKVTCLSRVIFVCNNDICGYGIVIE